MGEDDDSKVFEAEDEWDEESIVDEDDDEDSFEDSDGAVADLDEI